LQRIGGQTINPLAISLASMRYTWKFGENAVNLVKTNKVTTPQHIQTFTTQFPLIFSETNNPVRNKQQKNIEKGKSITKINRNVPQPPVNRLIN
jgi:hypothetical protein